MNAVWVALIVAVLGPVILHRLDRRTRRQEKLEDWARQDEVASTLLASNAAVAASTEEASGQLHQIHTLVNSNMTAEMQARLVATTGQLVLMRRVIVLNEEAGQLATEDELAAVHATEALVAELTAAVADRLEKTVAAEVKAGGIGTKTQQEEPCSE